MNYFKYALVVLWVTFTLYKEVVIGKSKKKKSDKESVQKNKPHFSILISRLETFARGLACFGSLLAYSSLTVAERFGALVHLSDFFVILISMTVYDKLCAANFSIEIEQALRQAVLITTI